MNAFEAWAVALVAGGLELPVYRKKEAPREAVQEKAGPVTDWLAPGGPGFEVCAHLACAKLGMRWKPGLVSRVGWNTRKGAFEVEFADGTLRG